MNNVDSLFQSRDGGCLDFVEVVIELLRRRVGGERRHRGKVALAFTGHEEYIMGMGRKFLFHTGRSEREDKASLRWSGS
jgi:hypothetical protein